MSGIWSSASMKSSRKSAWASVRRVTSATSARGCVSASGWRRRCSWPQVLILDEPTIGLDPGQIIEVRRLIQDLGKERTVMLSTHILSEAQQLCDRVLIINKGSIVAEDTPANLQAQLAGAEQLILRVSGPDDALTQAIGRIPGVAKVTLDPGGELRVETSPGHDVRAQLARTVVEQGYDLLELRAAGVSLESVFLELTKEGLPVGERD
jgi:ABC-2 type transport system ATP-binding protein